MTETALPRLTVIGTGYLGATHAICMASLGYEVVGLDTDPRKIERLQSGEVPFFEPGLPELLAKTMATGRLRFTTSVEEAAAHGDVHFICVGTPQKPGMDAADLTYVDASVAALAPLLDRKVLVVGKSTVPVGTAARLTALVKELAPAGDEIELAWNPEFLREGFAVDDTLRPDRLVFGVSSDWAREQLEASFRPIIDNDTPVVVTDLATAELVKVAANSFLATKISYINAMAEICEATGADVRHLAKALAHDDRIGGRFLQPGLGFGGGCLPKDIRAFAYRAEEIGVGQAVSFLREVDAINRRRRSRTIDLVREMLGGQLNGKKVACLGAAFKPNSDDIRDAPALDVARTMHGLGANVRVYDPAALDNARRAYPELRYGTSAMDVAQDADVVVLLTEWSEFREIEPSALAAVVAHRRIVDGRHALDAEFWRAEGWEYRALGMP
ncbi:UDP-glucose dehydrogenase family protein [Herbidospora sp. RD11066]